MGAPLAVSGDQSGGRFAGTFELSNGMQVRVSPASEHANSGSVEHGLHIPASKLVGQPESVVPEAPLPPLADPVPVPEAPLVGVPDAAAPLPVPEDPALAVPELPVAPVPVVELPALDPELPLLVPDPGVLLLPPLLLQDAASNPALATMAALAKP
jgi:hypothetical protein